jgi:hypothetical protein
VDSAAGTAAQNVLLILSANVEQISVWDLYRHRFLYIKKSKKK